MNEQRQPWRLVVPDEQGAALALAHGLEVSAARIALSTGRAEMLEVANRLRRDALSIRLLVERRELARTRRRSERLRRLISGMAMRELRA